MPPNHNAWSGDPPAQGPSGSGAAMIVAIIAAIGLIIASVVSWIAVGEACTNGNVPSGSPTDALCTLEGRHYTSVVLASAPVTLPVAVVIIAAIVAATRRDWRLLRWGLGIATVLIGAPFIALYVLY